MALTEQKRQALIKWLESMPWWDELPYAQLEAVVVDFIKSLALPRESTNLAKSPVVPSWVLGEKLRRILETLEAGRV